MTKSYLQLSAVEITAVSDGQENKLMLKSQER